MKTILHCITILLAVAVSVFAQDRSSEEVVDPEIQQIQARFSEKRKKFQRDARAHYADSLAALQKELQAAGKTTEAAVVEAELKQVMQQLNGGSTTAEAAAPADMDAVFAEMQDTAKNKDPNAAAEDNSSAKKEPQNAPPKVIQRSRYDLDLKGYVEFSWSEGAVGSWKLTTLPPGEYQVRLSYRGNPDQKAGECQVSIDGTEKPVTVEIAPSGRRVYRVDVGKVKLLKSGDSLRITATKVPKDKTLFQLYGVTLFAHKDGEAPPAMEEDPK